MRTPLFQEGTALNRESVKPLCRRLLSAVDKRQVGANGGANQSQSAHQRQLVRVNFGLPGTAVVRDEREIKSQQKRSAVVAETQK